MGRYTLNLDNQKLIKMLLTKNSDLRHLWVIPDVTGAKLEIHNRIFDMQHDPFNIIFDRKSTTCSQLLGRDFIYGKLARDRMMILNQLLDYGNENKY